MSDSPKIKAWFWFVLACVSLSSCNNFMLGGWSLQEFLPVFNVLMSILLASISIVPIWLMTLDENGEIRRTAWVLSGSLLFISLCFIIFLWLIISTATV
ncbi:MAG: hypothetical protein AAF387_11835 [Pseudomonadota bacterium]